MELGGRWHHVDMATPDLGRLGAAIKAHRLQRYPSRDAAAQAAGISKDTWQSAEEGRRVRDKSYSKIESALDWVQGSCMLIADGGAPMLADTAASVAASVAPRLTEEEVRAMVFKAATIEVPGAPIGEVQALVDRLVKDMRRTGELREEG